MTKQGFCKLSVPWRKLCLQGSLFILVLIQFQSHCHPSGWGGVGRLFKAGHLLHFSAFRMGTYLRWALIQGWALIQINMVLLILWKTKFFNILVFLMFPCKSNLLFSDTTLPLSISRRVWTCHLTICISLLLTQKWRFYHQM